MAWLRQQPIARRIRTALLRDLQRITGERADALAESRLRGLDPHTFVIQLHLPDGGAIASVTGIGDKALAALRRAFPAHVRPQRHLPPREVAASPSHAQAHVSGPNSGPTPASGVSDTADTALAELTAAADGLLVPSESDYPFVPFRWEGSGPLTPVALLAHLELPPDTPVETRAPETFFAPLTRIAEWMDEAQRAQAARFAALRDLIVARLRNAAVYRVGRVRITVVIAGQDAADTIVGLRTTLIET
jgi:hypothetical protein